MPANVLQFTPAADRLIDFRTVNALIGSRCRTSAVARALAREGKFRAVKINARVVRFVESSVINFVRGGEAA